jgi:hypothetical protein
MHASKWGHHHHHRHVDCWGHHVETIMLRPSSLRPSCCTIEAACSLQRSFCGRIIIRHVEMWSQQLFLTVLLIVFRNPSVPRERGESLHYIKVFYNRATHSFSNIWLFILYLGLWCHLSSLWTEFWFQCAVICRNTSVACTVAIYLAPRVCPGTSVSSCCNMHVHITLAQLAMAIFGALAEKERATVIIIYSTCI